MHLHLIFIFEKIVYNKKSGGSMKTLVIVPCFNEQDSIVEVVNSIKKEKLDYIVINDGSTDQTLQVLKKNNINYINLDNNLGIGGVMQTGYKYAFRNNYDIAIQFDGDGQHDSSYLKELIKPIASKEANLVIGSRFVGDKSEFKSTFLRRIGINVLSNLYKVITHKEIKDMTSGFRAADREVMEIFTKNYPYEYPEPVTNLLICNKKIKEIPVKMKKREHGKSSITPLKSMYYMINVILYFIIIILSRGDDYHA